MHMHASTHTRIHARIQTRTHALTHVRMCGAHRHTKTCLISACCGSRGCSSSRRQSSLHRPTDPSLHRPTHLQPRPSHRWESVPCLSFHSSILPIPPVHSSCPSIRPSIQLPVFLSIVLSFHSYTDPCLSILPLRHASVYSPIHQPICPTNHPPHPSPIQPCSPIPMPYAGSTDKAKSSSNSRVSPMTAGL